MQSAPAVILREGQSRTNDEVSVGVGIRSGPDPQQWDPNPERIRRLALAVVACPCSGTTSRRNGAVPRRRSRRQGAIGRRGRRRRSSSRAGPSMLRICRSPSSRLRPVARPVRCSATSTGERRPAPESRRCRRPRFDRRRSSGSLTGVTRSRRCSLSMRRCAQDWPPCRRGCGVATDTTASPRTCSRRPPRRSAGGRFNDARVEVSAWEASGV